MKEKNKHFCLKTVWNNIFSLPSAHVKAEPARLLGRPGPHLPWVGWWALCPQQEPHVVDAELARDERGVLVETPPHLLHTVFTRCGLGSEDPALLPPGLFVCSASCHSGLEQHLDLQWALPHGGCESQGN